MSCTKCKRRQLSLLANEVFQDARRAKKWLHSTDNMELLGKKPIDLIKTDEVKAEKLVVELYMAAASDPDQFDRENYEARVKRVTQTASLVLAMNEVAARDWMENGSHPELSGKTPKEALKDKDKARALENVLIRSRYGMYY